MQIVLHWKERTFQIDTNGSDSFQQVIKRFAAKYPDCSCASRMEDIRLLHNDEDVDLNCLVAEFIFCESYDFVIYLSKHSHHQKMDSQQVSDKNIRINLVNICTNDRYSQVVSNSSQVSKVIDNLKAALDADLSIVLFNHSGLLKDSETFRSLSIADNDMIGILPCVYPGAEYLHLQSLSFQRFAARAVFLEQLANTPWNLLEDITLSYTIQSPSAFVSLLPSLAHYPFTTLFISDSMEVLQMTVNKHATIQAKCVPYYSQLFVPWKYVTMMAIQPFFATLTQFKSLYMIDIHFENPTEPERQELIDELTILQLPFFIRINHKPFVSVQSYVDHIKKQQTSLQEEIQSLKTKLEGLDKRDHSMGDQTKEVIDMNLQLKQDLAFLREETIRLRTECEQAQAKLRTMSQHIGPICSSIQNACYAIRKDAERMHIPDPQIQRNIVGASNYCLQKIDQVLIHCLDSSASQKRPHDAYY